MPLKAGSVYLGEQTTTCRSRKCLGLLRSCISPHWPASRDFEETREGLWGRQVRRLRGEMLPWGLVLQLQTHVNNPGAVLGPCKASPGDRWTPGAHLSSILCKLASFSPVRDTVTKPRWTAFWGATSPPYTQVWHRGRFYKSLWSDVDSEINIQSCFSDGKKASYLLRWYSSWSQIAPGDIQCVGSDMSRTTGDGSILFIFCS